LVRLYSLGEVLASRPIVTYSEIFIQIDELVRKISIHKLFAHLQTHTLVKLKTSFLGVSVLVEQGNMLSSTSNFRRYSCTSIRSTNMVVKKGTVLDLNATRLWIFRDLLE